MRGFIGIALFAVVSGGFVLLCDCMNYLLNFVDVVEFVDCNYYGKRIILCEHAKLLFHV